MTFFRGWLLFLVLICCGGGRQVVAWDANWESLDSRPLPSWYDEGKFGIFLHWGVFSVPAYGSEWFWQRWHEGHPDYVKFIEETERKRFSYIDYAKRFDAVFYEPDYWADVFAKSGAQYVVLTSKHHEGFCNWDSRDVPSTWNWNSMEVGPRRDLLGDLSLAVKNVSSPHTNNTLRFGVYHSLFEWFNTAYRQDQASNFTKQDFVNSKTMPELYDLVNKYQPELIWSDGGVDAYSDYWQSKEFLAWYATHSPVADTAVWNDRWGRESMCNHGGFLTCADRYTPGKLVTKKWENALTIDTTSWGWNRNSTYDQYLTTEQLVHMLVETVAFNGNMLLNVGPRADGGIPNIFVDRLLGMGEWLKVNGDAIYGTRPWDVIQNETLAHTFFTTKGDLLYAIFTEWPDESLLSLDYVHPSRTTTITMLGLEDEEIEWSTSSGADITVHLPLLTPDIVPCDHAWVLAITDIESGYRKGDIATQK